MTHPYQMNRERALRIANDMNTNTNTSSRVRWDADEQRKVAAESFRIIQSDKTIHRMQAIELAQKKVLKPPRRRELGKTTFGQFKWIEPLWAEFEKEKQAGAKQGAEDLFALPETPAEKFIKDAATLPSPEEFKASTGFDMPAPLVSAPPSVTVVHDATPTHEPQHTTRRVVHWTEAEKQTLAERAYYLLKSFADMKPIEALRKAIESELPEDRHREIATLAMVDWFVPALDELKAAEQAEAQRLKEQQEIEARIARETAERIEREARAREEEINRRVNERVEGLSFDALITAFARKLATQALTAIREEFRNGIMEQALDALTTPDLPPTPPAPAQAEAPQPATPPKKLPKVMIVGLYPNQEQDVERAFRGTLEFDFVKSSKQGGTGEGGHAMLRRSSGCDVVVAMADSMGLDVVQKRRQLTVPYTQISGGSSNLKRWLGLFAEGKIELSMAKDV